MAGGLLDFAKTPMGMGLLSAAFGGLAGANRDTPWNNLGKAGLAGIAGYSAADALQQKQVELDKAKAIQDAIPTLYKTDASGNTTFDTIGGAKIGIDPATLKQYAELPNAGRAKVARTITVPGADGRPVTVQYDDYGQRVGEGVAKYEAPQLVDMGDRKQFVTPQAGQTFSVGMSPAQIDASNRGWASVANQQEANRITAGALNQDGYSTKPLPIGAAKMQDEALAAYGSAGTIDEILAGKQKQIEDGKLRFGPVSNKANEALNAAGFSSEESRNYASFMSDLERMRNESLRLNSGVQTDGDAQRAWNELFQNVNDTDLVKQRLSEIRALNKRAAELQRLRVDNIRTNYNVAPYEFEGVLSPGQAAKPEQAPGNLTNAQNPPANPQRTVVRTGTFNGRKVVQYSDGSVEHAN